MNMAGTKEERRAAHAAHSFGQGKTAVEYGWIAKLRCCLPSSRLLRRTDMDLQTGPGGHPRIVPREAIRMKGLPVCTERPRWMPARNELRTALL
jgi:hypothetical protein